MKNTVQNLMLFILFTVFGANANAQDIPKDTTKVVISEQKDDCIAFGDDAINGARITK